MRYLPENVVHIDNTVASMVTYALPRQDALLYIDEVYAAAFSQLYALHNMQTFEQQLDIFFDGWYINPYEEVSLDGIIMFAQRVRFISQLFYDSIQTLYETIEAIENEIVDQGVVLSGLVTRTNTEMEKVKAGIARAASTTSIKDEVIIYDTFDSNTVFTSNGLALDTDAGLLSLGVTDIRQVGYRIKSVSMRGIPKGSIAESVWGKDTFAAINNGYFHGRTFSSTPRINDTRSSSLSALTDGDLTTAYEVELNTTAILHGGFGMTLTLEPLAECNTFIASLTVPTTESTIASPSYELLLDRFYCNDYDYSLVLTDERITTDTIVAGSIAPLWSYGMVSCMSSRYPIPLTRGPVEVGLCTRTPQLAAFPEIVFLNSENREVYRMNYFETLAVRRVEVPKETTDPRTLFTPEQLSKLASSVASSRLTVHTELSTVYRYYIGIKELGFALASYATEGSCVSSDLNAAGRKIVGVDIYSSEYIPPGTHIYYAVSVDKEEWIPIVPANRLGGGNKRVVFSTSLDPKEGDVYVPASPGPLYVKISMSGGGYTTPLVRSLIVRMKVETN